MNALQLLEAFPDGIAESNPVKIRPKLRDNLLLFQLFGRAKDKCTTSLNDCITYQNIFKAILNVLPQ